MLSPEDLTGELVLSRSKESPQHSTGCVRMKTLQYIENLLGGLACSILSLFSFLLVTNKTPEPSKVKRVLCVKFWGIGSLILATPFLEEAKRTFPNAKIELLTLSGNKGVVKMLPGVDAVHYLDLGSNLFEAICAFVRCMFSVRTMGYDVLIDLEFYTRASAILAFFSGAATRVGYHSQGVWRGNFHTHRIAFNVYRHVTANFYNLLEPFGVKPACDAINPKVSLGAGGEKEVVGLLKRLGVAGPFFVVNVNAGELAYERRWAPERYVALVSDLCAEYKATALFVGSPSEREYVNSVVERIAPGAGQAVNIAGELSLDGLGELFKQCSFVVTNDSGPLHLAVAVGARVASFFGPETPVLYGPVGVGHLVFFSCAPCSPCINAERAKDLQCWQSTVRCQEEIGVDETLVRIRSEFSSLF